MRLRPRPLLLWMGWAAGLVVLASSVYALCWVLLSESWRPSSECGVPAGLRLAHRGFVSEHPPNSLGAILDAVRRGYAPEMDVVLLSDDEVVLFHDWNMMRLAGVDRSISTVSSDELESIRLQRVIDGWDYGRREPGPRSATS